MNSTYKAAIDIGSNSILLLIVDSSNNEVCFESRITSLGKDLDKTKNFNPTSMKDSYNALREYSEICSTFQINFNKVRITATEASRVAINASEFFDKVYKELGATVCLISGEEEARLSARGALFNQVDKLEDEIVTLMDIGGGSTELIRVQVEPFQILDVVSLPLGSVRVTDWITQGIWEIKKRELSKMINTELYKTNSLIGVAGTMASLFHIYENKQYFEVTPLLNNLMSVKKLDEKFNEANLGKASPDSLLKQFSFLGKRSKVIIGGYEVCRMICEKLSVEKIQVSMQGLVHGSVIEVDKLEMKKN